MSDLDPTAIIRLAARSTPDAVRNHAVERLAAGERITCNAIDELVRRMVGALVKGYTYMLARPDDAAQIMLAREPALPADVIQGQVRETVDLAETAAFKDHGYGWADPAKLRFTIDTLSRAEGMAAPPPANEIHTNAFLPAR